MVKKTITTPIVLLKVKGNFKEKASLLNITAITSYESHIDQTFIVAKVEDEEGVDSKVSEIYRDMLGIKENDFVSVQYSKAGIDFIFHS